ncbi:phosphotransferase [Altererythrobacter salegens]|uniref:Phosphotransferase n=1 Tax=Croceibacterium salegens TaxID=1737568 RepID=A0A6I4T249_9SPHN|nr:phosphotransferase [Croceibacterium salegens]MXO60722.1 phosphotransferase [Croceibacterium salegens]
MSNAPYAPCHPAFAKHSQVIPLSGFSGAVVALLRAKGGGRFVRKAAREPSVNEILRRQCGRQKMLSSILTEAVKVPAVLGEGEAAGLYYFDMAFVPSQDAASFLSKAPFDEIVQFSHNIEDLISVFAKSKGFETTLAQPQTTYLTWKFEEISQRTSGRYDACLLDLMEASRQTSILPPMATETASHGDLTFENILVASNRDLWLIDPIASPVSHYWFDWSKLFQETEGRWHNHRGRPISLCVSWWLRNRWIASAMSESEEYLSRHYLLLGLTFARILPYAKSELDRLYLVERITAYGKAALRGVEKIR